MSYSIVQSPNLGQLLAYQASQEFRDMFLTCPYAKVSQGVLHDVELDEVGTLGTLHYLLVEDQLLEDNATFMLNADGTVAYWASGVEV